VSTFGGLVDSTLLYLLGFTTQQDQETYITANIDANDLTIPVADTTAMSRGIIEIGDELIRVDDVNPTGLVATVPPYGRGYRSTTPASHLNGARVVVAPMFPRVMVKEALNQATQAIYPMVSAIGDTTFTFNPAVSTYALPAGTQNVVSVSWQTTGPSKEWVPVRRYRVDTAASTGAFPTGATISLYDSIVPGRSVKVVYSKPPTSMTSESGEFSTVTGLPSTCEDVARLGAALRLVPFLDSPHLSGFSAEADFSSNNRQVGAAAQLSRFLMQQYQMRLQEEANRQDAYFPVRSHYTR
jgi:hypothetical protein